MALSYQLKVDGQVVETVKAESPLQFVYGTGFLLPAFEANLAGLGKGDPFAFRLDAANAYGEVIPDAVVELPKEVFMVDGKIEDGMLEIGGDDRRSARSHAGRHDDGASRRRMRLRMRRRLRRRLRSRTGERRLRLRLSLKKSFEFTDTIRNRIQKAGPSRGLPFTYSDSG